jgi:predicted O-methyltransferase YrrM
VAETFASKDAPSETANKAAGAPISVDPKAIAEAILARAEGHYHDEQVNSARRARALDPLPFAPSSRLLELVQACYQTDGAASGRERVANQYALMPDTLDFLAALLDRLAPKLVMEFGSGESTRLFAEWAAPRGARLISVEHDRSWVSEVIQRLDARQRDAVKMVHAPLRPTRRGLRQFLTYRFLDQLIADVRQADLLLLDGPHISGREVVQYFVLSHCRPGAIVVIDDFRHYSVREMLIGVPPSLATCFAGVPIVENSHGLYLLQCLKEAPRETPVPNLGVRSILRSYWRSLRDYRTYGTGD